ncbi:MAG TPA: cyclic nucleotide-binding domain-containing protein [Candidatus Limnocylindrales bacterium]|nr:cyclic nucleotide-binding domain-containing protein [Candidatus Limnocylindrales bacterium]
MLTSLADRVRPSVDALRQIAANPGLLRLELGSLAWSAADWTYLVGLSVLAFEAGGTGAVALVSVIRSVPTVVLVPLVLGATDVLPRDHMLRLVVWGRVGFLVVASGLVITGATPALIYVFAGVDAVASALLRPLRSALTPALARTPEELVAANVATTTGDAFAAMVGPGLAALILAVGEVPATYVAAALMIAVALAAVLPLHAAPDLERTAAPKGDGAPKRPRLSIFQTARDLMAMPHARVIVLLFAAQRFVRGVITVAIVAAAFDLLGLGEPGVGLLTSAIGLGGLFGGALALGFVARPRLAPVFAAGLLAWGGGILAAGIVPNVFVVVLVFAIAGIGKTTLDTTGFTLLQRTTPNDRRSNVFALLEGVIAAVLGIGPVVAALMIDAIGASWTLVIAGALPLVLVALTWPVLRFTDDEAVVPQPAFRLLTNVAMFRPLQLTTLETLARQMVRRDAAAGSDVIRQGEHGDTFFIVETGRLATVIDGVAVNELGAGDSFGEIALLQASERTATVRAVEDSRLVELAGDPFLAAVASTGDSAAAADEVVRGRLAATA